MTLMPKMLSGSHIKRLNFELLALILVFYGMILECVVMWWFVYPFPYEDSV